jgi:redox-sensitive bicupin YhaK (pirin superfamily)
MKTSQSPDDATEEDIVDVVVIPRSSDLGDGFTVRRALPSAQRRMVGLFVFFDHMGPVVLGPGQGLDFSPNTHIGLASVTYLFSGEILHRDSLGSVQRIEPGALNLMTAGRGISHSEESPEPHSPRLHGVQFWIALPDAARTVAPAFEHHPRVPRVRTGGLRISVLAGELLGERSPARTYTPLVGLSIEAPAASLATLPLREDFEYGAIVTHGSAEIAGQPAGPGSMVYLPPGGSGLPLVTGAGDAGIVVVGGLPLAEDVLMWWNFVARTKDELSQASRDWNAGAAYLGEVRGYDGERLTAPLPPWARDGG